MSPPVSAVTGAIQDSHPHHASNAVAEEHCLALPQTAEEGTCRGYPFVSRGSRAKRCRSSVPSGRSMANSPRSSRARARAAATASSRLTNSAIVVPLCSSTHLEPFGRTRKRSLGIVRTYTLNPEARAFKAHRANVRRAICDIVSLFEPDQHPKRPGRSSSVTAAFRRPPAHGSRAPLERCHQCCFRAAPAGRISRRT